MKWCNCCFLIWRTKGNPRFGFDLFAGNAHTVVLCPINCHRESQIATIVSTSLSRLITREQKRLFFKYHSSHTTISTFWSAHSDAQYLWVAGYNPVFKSKELGGGLLKRILINSDPLPLLRFQGIWANIKRFFTPIPLCCPSIHNCVICLFITAHHEKLNFPTLVMTTISLTSQQSSTGRFTALFTKVLCLGNECRVYSLFVGVYRIFLIILMHWTTLHLTNYWLCGQLMTEIRFSFFQMGFVVNSWRRANNALRSHSSAHTTTSISPD